MKNTKKIIKFNSSLYSTNLEKLINKLNLNDFEYIRLDDVCEIKKGTQLNKDKLNNKGKYPVINGGQEPSGYWHEYNVNANTITISQGGNSAGFINLIYTNFFAGAHCYYLILKSKNINYKFLYYFLKNNQDKIMNYKVGTAIPGINKEQIANILIPVPHLKIQQHIVNTIIHLFLFLKFL